MNLNNQALWLKGGLIGVLILTLISGGESLYEYYLNLTYSPGHLESEMEGIITCLATFPICLLVLEVINYNLRTEVHIILSILLYFLLGAGIGYLIQIIKIRRNKNL